MLSFLFKTTPEYYQVPALKQKYGADFKNFEKIFRESISHDPSIKAAARAKVLTLGDKLPLFKSYAQDAGAILEEQNAIRIENEKLKLMKKSALNNISTLKKEISAIDHTIAGYNEELKEVDSDSDEDDFSSRAQYAKGTNRKKI